MGSQTQYRSGTEGERQRKEWRRPPGGEGQERVMWVGGLYYGREGDDGQCRRK